MQRVIQNVKQQNICWSAYDAKLQQAFYYDKQAVYLYFVVPYIEP